MELLERMNFQKDGVYCRLPSLRPRWPVELLVAVCHIGNTACRNILFSANLRCAVLRASVKCCCSSLSRWCTLPLLSLKQRAYFLVRVQKHTERVNTFISKCSTACLFRCSLRLYCKSHPGKVHLKVIVFPYFVGSFLRACFIGSVCRWRSPGDLKIR